MQLHVARRHLQGQLNCGSRVTRHRRQQHATRVRDARVGLGRGQVALHCGHARGPPLGRNGRMGCRHRPRPVRCPPCLSALVQVIHSFLWLHDACLPCVRAWLPQHGLSCCGDRALLPDTTRQAVFWTALCGQPTLLMAPSLPRVMSMQH